MASGTVAGVIRKDSWCARSGGSHLGRDANAASSPRSSVERLARCPESGAEQRNVLEKERRPSPIFGVVKRKLTVTTNITLAPRLPSADRRGDQRRSADQHADDQLDDADHLRAALHAEAG